MRRGIIAIVVFLLLLTLPTAVRYLQYRSLTPAERTPAPDYDPAAVVASVATPPASQFVDDPAVGEGLVLLDEAHGNLFALTDIASLNGRLARRGITVESFTGGDLARSLRAANAFIVIAPTNEFTQAEVQAVINFVNRGGRLLLIGDPTRFNVFFDEEDPFATEVIIETDEIALNSLSSHFDITFLGDYLYNTQENEGNFRNILLQEAGFAESDLTTGLETVVFYSAHSLQVGPMGEVLLAGDDQTWSSATDRPGGLTLGATSRDGHVLALSDIHFMNDPYHTVYDNGRFIANIADFLAAPERDYVLADFPYFFGDEVALTFTDAPDLGAGAFVTVIPMQEGFRAIGKDLTLTGTAAANSETIHLGLYNQSDSVADLLAANDIALVIDPPILTEEELAAQEEKEGSDEDAEEEEEAAEESEAGEEESDAEEETAVEEEEEITETRVIQSELGNIEMSGMALVLLDGNEMVVLAASAEGLSNTVSRLLDLIPLEAEDALAECLVQGNVALCPSGVAEEEVEAELITHDGTAVAADEEEEPDEEDGEEPEDEEPPSELDADIQGNIGLDETVEGELGEAENHGWIFAEGPATIDITFEPSEDMDGVLEIYDPDNELMASSDQPFKGEVEELIGIEIPDDGEYTIVVREFFDAPGSYTLTVTGEAGEASESPGDLNVFYFADDDGTAIGAGFTSQDALAPFLVDYEVQYWLSSEDGPLDEDALADADFLIWDSGDYRNIDGFLDPDTGVIFSYLETGKPVFITGSSPTLLGDIDLAPVADIEIIGDDPILTNGYESGDIITLDDPYEAALSDLLLDDAGNTDTPFMARGPDSDGAGNVLSIASIDEFNNDQQNIILLLPFAVLPEADQVLYFENMMAWFEF